MKSSTRSTAVAVILAVMAIGCGGAFKGATLPPITVVIPQPKPAPGTPMPRATLAFQVVDAESDAPIGWAVVTVIDAVTNQGSQQHVKDDGYVAFGNLKAGGTAYDVTVEAEDYATITRKVQLGMKPSEQDGDGNRQDLIKLKSMKPKPVPVPTPVPAPTPQPEPPKPTPQPPALRPTCVELECVRLAAGTYGHLLTINTFESCLEFTQRVLELLGSDWGHVGKTASEGQSVPKGFAPVDARGSDGKTYRITGVSHDAIKHRVTGQVVDLLGNATANEPCDPAKVAPDPCWKPGPASIQWGVIPQFSADGRLQWRVENPFIPAVPVR